MKKVFKLLGVTILFTCFVSICSPAQELIGEMPVEISSAPQNFVLGDSVVLVYPGLVSIIRPHEPSTSWNVGDIQGKQIYQIVRQGNFTYFYFVRPRSVIGHQWNVPMEFGIIQYDHALRSASMSNTTVKSEGRVLGSYIKNGTLTLISYHGATKSLNIQDIDGVHASPARTFHITIDLDQNANIPVAIISSNKIPRLSQAVSLNKIFIDDKSIVVVSDESPLFENEGDKIYKTTIFRGDLQTGKYSYKVIPTTRQGKFRSFYFDNLLFKLTLTPNRVLEVYSVESGTRLSTQTLPNKTLKEAGFNPKNNAYQGVIVSRDSTNNFIITLAAHTALNGQYRQPQMTELTAQQNLLYFEHADVLNLQTFETSCFWKGTPEKGFTLCNEPIAPLHRINRFEAEQVQNKKPFKLKRYLYTPSSIIAFYNEAGSDVLKILRFY